jgi:UDP-glucuronate 4-epimerase
MDVQGPILITGAAGFIGFHLARRLLADGCEVIGLDNMCDYYDVALKQARLDQLLPAPGFRFLRLDVADRDAVARLFESWRIRRVVHLAAQAGVRHSIGHPHAFVDANIVGFGSILEACRQGGVEHLVFASSSSVYGTNRNTPFATTDRTDHPISMYAATKKANELMAHAYAHLHDMPVTGLRFFSVYGPWGRPDMAYFLFARAILEGTPIRVFNQGRMQRDFTYIDDVVEGLVRVLDHRPQRALEYAGLPPGSRGPAPFRLFNIGNNRPVELGRFIQVLEEALGVQARKEYLPMQAGDVEVTCADVSDLMAEVGFSPSTPLEEGLARFVAWYLDYYGVAEAGTSGGAGGSVDVAPP